MSKSLLQTLEKAIKRIPGMVLLKSLLAVMFVILIGGSFWAIRLRVSASSTGRTLGETAGIFAGRAIGSAKGLTEGQLAGSAAGKKEGLSAKDTTAELANKIHEMAKLEVLVVNGTYCDTLKHGDDYAALVAMKYSAVYTVDLETAVIEPRNDILYIHLDLPTVELYPASDIEKINEYQRSAITGSVEEGYNAFINSSIQITKKAEERLQKDDSLMITAQESAESQLTQLAEAATLTNSEVKVDFKEEAKQ